ncbi:hypothetical protein Cob_v011610 [Colletotrichum orbiculare MAFF 240422]|uniref:Uncharacterized protein n=1 Tax=Colletotrichum orbiculare (strain 104-T / ATCC 96160 / CBS 514.97 / LARS 414 / MAFF 240422) TaxID=1213857 RepID=A0A484FD68_COLOR|nr:hypothetical protein Cob_v011610 [Colletotrichum orbiculare MAFF 240422]
MALHPSHTSSDALPRKKTSPGLVSKSNRIDDNSTPWVEHLGATNTRRGWTPAAHLQPTFGAGYAVRSSTNATRTSPNTATKVTRQLP